MQPALMVTWNRFMVTGNTYLRPTQMFLHPRCGSMSPAPWCHSAGRRPPSTGTDPSRAVAAVALQQLRLLPLLVLMALPLVQPRMTLMQLMRRPLVRCLQPSLGRPACARRYASLPAGSSGCSSALGPGFCLERTHCISSEYIRLVLRPYRIRCMIEA